jgi:16S rRNA processing protein RimM
MNLEQCFEAGIIGKPHGFKGQVNIILDVDDPSIYFKIQAVLVDRHGDLIPYMIEHSLTKGSKWVVKFEGIDTEELARSLTGYKISLPDDLLPQLGADQFYFHEIIGFSVIDTKLGPIGTIQEVYANGPQNLFGVLYTDETTEILVPISDEIIEKLDKPNSTIYLNTPEGLVDLYLGK